MVWQCDVCVCVFSFVLFPAIPIPELIQCYHLTFFTSFWTGPPITFQVACLFGLGELFGLFVFWFAFVAFCVVVFFVLFFSMDCDGCWTMYRFLTSPLLWLPSLMAASLYALIS